MGYFPRFQSTVQDRKKNRVQPIHREKNGTQYEGSGRKNGLNGVICFGLILNKDLELCILRMRLKKNGPLKRIENLFQHLWIGPKIKKKVPNTKILRPKTDTKLATTRRTTIDQYEIMEQKVKFRTGEFMGYMASCHGVGQTVMNYTLVKNVDSSRASVWINEMVVWMVDPKA